MREGGLAAQDFMEWIDFCHPGREWEARGPYLCFQTGAEHELEFCGQRDVVRAEEAQLGSVGLDQML